MFCLFAELMLRNVRRAVLRCNEQNGLFSSLPSCRVAFLIIVWRRSSNSSSFSELPSNLSVVVLTGCTVSVCSDGRLFMPTSTSANRLIKSEEVFWVVVSGAEWQSPETHYGYILDVAAVQGISWDAQ